MLDFLALVKAQAAVDFVGDAGAEQGLFQNARLRIAAVEHRHLRQIPAFALQRPCFVHHKLGFFAVVDGLQQADFFARIGIGAQIFAQTPAIVGNQGIGGGEDVAVGAVVLLQLNRLINGKFAHQRRHIAHMRAAKAVDALVVVAHRKHRRMFARQQLKPSVLQLVGVLKFVHQNMFEAVLVVVAQGGVGLQ